MRSVTKQYAAYIVIIAMMGASVIYMCVSLYVTTHPMVFYDSKHFHFRPKVFPLLNPIVDVRNRALSVALDTSSNGTQTGPSDRTSALVDKILERFITGRIDEIDDAFAGYSYYDQDVGLNFDFPEPELRSVKSHFSKIDTQVVVRTLDRTLLLTAALYERMGFAKAAEKYYLAYYSALKRFLPPGMDDGDFYASARASLARLKLHSILPVYEHLDDGYRTHSYLNLLIDNILGLSLTSDEMRFYRRRSIIGESDASGIYLGSMPAPTSLGTNLTEQAVLGGEYCLYLLNYEPDNFGGCDLEGIEKQLGGKSFMLSSIYYKALLKSMQRGAVIGSSKTSWQSEPVTDVNVNAGDEADAPIKPPKLSWSDFTMLRDSVRSHSGPEAAHFTDDLMAFEYDHLDPTSPEAITLLCKIKDRDPRASDFALVAAAKVRENAVSCTK